MEDNLHQRPALQILWTRPPCFTPMHGGYAYNVPVLLELLFAKLGYFSISCLSRADITHAVDFICTSWCLLYVLCVYLLYFVLWVRYT